MVPERHNRIEGSKWFPVLAVADPGVTDELAAIAENRLTIRHEQHAICRSQQLGAPLHEVDQREALLDADGCVALSGRLGDVDTKAHQVGVQVTHDPGFEKEERKAQLGRRRSLLGGFRLGLALLDGLVLFARDQEPTCSGVSAEDAATAACARELPLLLALDDHETTIVFATDPAAFDCQDEARSGAQSLSPGSSSW